jgi:serine/threonine-protein kinase PknK
MQLWPNLFDRRAREQEVLALMRRVGRMPASPNGFGSPKARCEKHVRSILTKLNRPETGDGYRRVRVVITFLEAH